MSYFLYEVTVKHTQQKLEIVTERRCVSSEHFDVKFINRWSDFCIDKVRNALARANKSREMQKEIEGVKTQFGYAAELLEENCRENSPPDIYDDG